MTRTHRALRLSPLAFALAFGAYSENFSAVRSGAAATETQATVALDTEIRKPLPADDREA